MVKKQLLYILLNYVGLTYVIGMIFALVVVNVFYTCPAVFGGFRGCWIPIISGLVMAFNVLLNCWLFHAAAPKNRTEAYFPRLSESHPVQDATKNGLILQDGLSLMASNGMMSTRGGSERLQVDYRTLPTKFCTSCNATVLSRCYHCPVCNYCILKCDHHCFLVSGCVGFGNQRYFIVLLFWAALGSGLGLYIMASYLSQFYSPFLPFGFLQYFIPVALYNVLFGSLCFSHFCLVVLFNLGFVAFCSSSVFFVVQWICILNGRRMLRMLGSFDPGDSLSPKQRIKSVFGPYWALNFVFPLPFPNKIEYLQDYLYLSTKEL